MSTVTEETPEITETTTDKWVYLFDEGRQTFLTRAAGLGMDAHEYIKQDLIAVREVDPGELTPGEFVSTLRDCVERDRTRVVVIDSLNGYLTAMPDERALALNLREVIRYLGHHGVLTLLVVAEHRLVGGVLDPPVDISYLADTVLMLRYFEAAGEVRRAITVAKRRTGSHGRTIHELRIGPGIHVGGPLTEFEGVLAGSATRARPPSRKTDDR